MFYFYIFLFFLFHSFKIEVAPGRKILRPAKQKLTFLCRLRKFQEYKKNKFGLDFHLFFKIYLICKLQIAKWIFLMQSNQCTLTTYGLFRGGCCLDVAPKTFPDFSWAWFFSGGNYLEVVITNDSHRLHKF